MLLTNYTSPNRILSMKRYSKDVLIKVILIFLFDLIFTNFCYAQPSNSKPVAAQKKMTSVEIEAFVFKKQFFKAMPLENLKIKSVPACKAIFIKACGAEDFPKLKKFESCLQDKFETFKQKSDCSNFAHALLHAGFLSRLPRVINQCRVLLEDCEYQIKNGKSGGILGCVLRRPNLPPICDFLVNEAYNYRVHLAQIYDAKLSAELKANK